jgi:hypothetical protein
MFAASTGPMRFEMVLKLGIAPSSAAGPLKLEEGVPLPVLRCEDTEPPPPLKVDTPAPAAAEALASANARSMTLEAAARAADAEDGSPARKAFARWR